MVAVTIITYPMIYPLLGPACRLHGVQNREILYYGCGLESYYAWLNLCDFGTTLAQDACALLAQRVRMPWVVHTACTRKRHHATP